MKQTARRANGAPVRGGVAVGPFVDRPRGFLSGAALGQMKTPVVDASGDENVPIPVEHQIRMRRAPGR
jgi:hypothetical protein